MSERKWEYKVLQNNDTGKDLEQWLNAQEDTGWHLHAVAGLDVIFRRKYEAPWTPDM